MSVFQVGAGVGLSIPAESGFVSRRFDFVLQGAELEVLEASHLRHKLREFILQARLQRRMTAGSSDGTEEEILPVLRAVLRGTDRNLAEQVAAVPNSNRIRDRVKEAVLREGTGPNPAICGPAHDRINDQCAGLCSRLRYPRG